MSWIPNDMISISLHVLVEILKVNDVDHFFFLDPKRTHKLPQHESSLPDQEVQTSLLLWMQDEF